MTIKEFNSLFNELYSIDKFSGISIYKFIFKRKDDLIVEFVINDFEFSGHISVIKKEGNISFIHFTNLYELKILNKRERIFELKNGFEGKISKVILSCYDSPIIQFSSE